jgi:hypothetical protein
MHVLMTGPLRPSLNAVLHLHSQCREAFPGCITYIAYWATTDSDRDHLATVFDHVFPLLQPTNEFIDANVTGRTIQSRDAPRLWPHIFYTNYKATVSIRSLIELVNIPDSETVLRIRSDAYLLDISPNLSSFLETIDVDTYYTIQRPVSSANGVCDCFAITSFKTLKKVWSVNDNFYNEVYSSVFNIENAVKKILSIRGVPNGIIPRDIIQFAICRKFTAGDIELIVLK